jgi:hypothetical protein
MANCLVDRDAHQPVAGKSRLGGWVYQMRASARVTREEMMMWDLVMVGVGIVMFLALFGYIWACEQLRDPQEDGVRAAGREELRQ